jgi:predicted glutamine amidotransferase
MRALRSELPDDLYSELKGSSDSETLFLLAVAMLREGSSLVEALEATARTIHSRVGKDEAQFNMLLSDGDRIAAVRSGTGLLTNSLYVAERPPFAPNGVVLASEAPESGAVWSPVDGHSWIEVDRELTVNWDPLLL